MDEQGRPEHFHMWPQMYKVDGKSPKQSAKKSIEKCQPGKTSTHADHLELNKTFPETLKASKGPLLTATKIK